MKYDCDLPSKIVDFDLWVDKSTEVNHPPKVRASNDTCSGMGRKHTEASRIVKGKTNNLPVWSASPRELNGL